jgi:hypothetical protein
MKEKRVARILAIISLILAVLVGILGVRREARDTVNYMYGIIPDSSLAHALGGDRFVLYANDHSKPVSFLIRVSAPAYGGEMDVVVLLDSTGIIRDLKVAGHRETPSFLEKIEKRGLRTSLIGKSYMDPFTVGEDVDVVSGATYSSQAIIRCAREGSRLLARDQLHLKVSEAEVPELALGIPEISLLVLYMLAFLGIYRFPGRKKTIRWITMLGGLLILGFWFAVPLTLSRLNVFLLGFFPDWHAQLYWYLLLGAFILSIILTRKNIYCHWICPLGAFQECVGALGVAKPRLSKRFNGILKWVQRSVALLAILLALYFRNPVKVDYEIFSVALSLTGPTYLFLLTGIFIMASAFIHRPWCNYLCPIVPIEDMLRLLNRKKTN